jgi:predicted transcriptional regulator of viral defense system
MKLAGQIRATIEKLPKGRSFGYADLGIAKNEFQTAAKALERLQKKGIIKKISKGVFYIPEQTVFGELQPGYNEQLRPYLFKNGKRIAYITGASLYNQLGLTTQVAFRIKIASRSNRIAINRGALKADAVKSYTEVTDANYNLLELLDALKDIRKIPDSSPGKAVKMLSNKIKSLDEKQLTAMLKYALLYPPRVRALLGAIIQNTNSSVNTNKLIQSLNPLTNFKLGLKEKDLPTIKNWNIT